MYVHVYVLLAPLLPEHLCIPQNVYIMVKYMCPLHDILLVERFLHAHKCSSRTYYHEGFELWSAISCNYSGTLL